jgi:NADP-dependent 3-hydroxy acid dehydrogenase YdfG
MNKLIFITGATSGIGEAAARLFAQAGDDLILTGRRSERLLNLSKELEQTFGVEVRTLCFDVRDQKEVVKNIDGLTGKWKCIDVLINNAGLAAGLDKIQHGSTEDWDTMIDTNIKGLLYVSRQIIPLFIKQKKGHIINIGSTASKVVYEKGNVYSASKFAVDALSKSMRLDLLEHGIKVTQISPGAAETEFSVVRFKGDKSKADSIYKGFKPLSAADIASAIYYTANLPEHVCINELEITALAQANSTHINKK